MSPLSPFRKSKKDDDPLDVSDESLESAEEEGLFMKTGGQADSGDEQRAVEPAPPQDEVETDGPADAADDLEEAAAGDPATSDPVAIPSAGAVAELSGVKTVSLGDDSTKDMLSAFHDDGAEDVAGPLTKGLEDIPIADILSELREVRAMLPTVADDSETTENENDGE